MQADGVQAGRRRATPLTPETIRTVQFPRAALGRRGYQEEEVRRFLGRIAEDIGAANAEKAHLRAEVDRLRNWYRNAGVNVDGRVESRGGPAVPNAQAIALMSQAQQAADLQVAQAEDYARRLLAEARQQYETILREAQRRAHMAAEQATVEYRNGAPRDEDRVDLERRIAWLRTFAQVTQIQLRSTLEALTRELDKLDELPTEVAVGEAAAARTLPRRASTADHR